MDHGLSVKFVANNEAWGQFKPNTVSHWRALPRPKSTRPRSNWRWAGGNT